MDMSAPAISIRPDGLLRVRPLMRRAVIRDIETIVSDDDRPAV